MSEDLRREFVERGRRAQQAVAAHAIPDDWFVLIEGRGFWREFHRQRLVWLVTGDGRWVVRPKAQCWAGTRFLATEDDPHTFLCPQPAIGPDNGALEDFYRPGGWSWPDEEHRAGRGAVAV